MTVLPKFRRHFSITGAALLVLAAAPVPKEKGSDPEPTPIVGTVVDASDMPVGNVSIDVFRNYPRPKRMDPIKAGPDGQFRVSGHWANSAESRTLVVRDEGRLGWCEIRQQTYDQKVGQKQLRIHLLPLTKKVRGTLVDSAGKPIAGVLIQVGALLHRQNRFSGIFPYLVPGSKTNDQGAFEVTIPSTSGGWLWPDGPWLVRKRITFAYDDEDVGRIEVAEGGQISGRVLNFDGKPVVGAMVGAQAHREVPLAGPGSPITDAEGRYRISGLPPGVYNVLFWPPESNDKLAAPAKDGAAVDAKKETVVDLKAAEGRLLTGRVVDAESGEGARDCYVGYYGVARPRSGAAIIGCTTDTKGTFNFYVPPGMAYVYISGGQVNRLKESEYTLEVPEKGEVPPVVLRVLKPATKEP
jgi:Carboxypeptidase regulatory-like domain